MDDTVQTIGMADLLDEVSRDLEDFRRKHASDYGVKNVTMWWELERERLLIRHKEARVARRFMSRRRVWMLAVGCIATFAAGALSTILIR
jgi:hypothetical protein